MMRKTAGKAAAVKLGLKIAIERGKQYLALIDGDGSYDPEAFREMMPLLVNAQMVVGCRPYSKIAYGRRLANHLMNLLVLILYGQKVKDMASGIRILEVSAFEPYFDAVGFNVEPQLCCLAIKNRYDVKQVDINYFPRVGKSKSSPIHVLLACIEIVRIRFLYQSQP
jgi:glycosyltransferase involved in cell wall biosynthesis